MSVYIDVFILLNIIATNISKLLLINSKISMQIKMEIANCFPLYAYRANHLLHILFLLKAIYFFFYEKFVCSLVDICIFWNTLTFYKPSNIWCWSFAVVELVICISGSSPVKVCEEVLLGITYAWDEIVGLHFNKICWLGLEQ